MAIDLPTPTTGGPSPKLSDLHKCTICTGKVKTRCGKCKETYYCGAACQQTDWNLQKVLCSSLKNFTTRPSPDMRRALLFKDDPASHQTCPQFVWIKAPDGEQGRKVEATHVKRLIGDNAEVQFIWENSVRNRAIFQDGILVLHKLPSSSFLGGMTPEQAVKLGRPRPNKSLERILCASALWLQKDIVPWRNNIVPAFGNIFVTSADLVDTNNTMDFNLQDLRNLVDHLSCQTMKDNTDQTMPYSAWMRKELRYGLFDVGRPSRGLKTYAQHRNHQLMGVRVAAVGDGDLTFTPVQVPRDHPFLLDTASRLFMRTFGHRQSKFDIPTKVKLPLSWIRHPNLSLEHDPLAKPLRPEISDIRDALLSELSLGFAKSGSQKHFDFTFFRIDTQDLALEHMQALCGFCGITMPLLKANVPDSMVLTSEASFEHYFQKSKAQCGWSGVLSPYQVPNTGSCRWEGIGFECGCKKESSLSCCHTVWAANGASQMNSEAGNAKGIIMFSMGPELDAPIVTASFPSFN